MGQKASKTEGETMKAVIMHGVGGRKFVDDKAKPVIKEGQILVRVKAAAVNPVDYKLQKAALFMPGKVMAVDCAGVVEEVGAKVTGFAKGDRVFGTAAGSLAEFAKCKSSAMAKIPDSMTFVEAASLPVTFLTAYQGLTNFGYKKGQRLVIIGASGGAGTAAVIMGRAIGGPDAEIIGICSGKNAEMVKSLGADRIIDYTKEDPLSVLGKGNVDFVYDAASFSGGGEDYMKAGKEMITSDGMYVSLNGPLSSWLRMATGMQEEQRKIFLADYSGADLAKIVELLASSDAKPVIGKVLEFSEENVETAYSDLQGRRTKGKIVLTMDADANTSAST
ncbi:Alcohol dehydrogenase 1 [Hondaea fermentalgiana]|uniref:Alcohol dehydrogenase 1 n=1 Tax=Hondaea fermentalgiana TaxID=2315210 RepID=A0A2R5GUX4_9STRA|nr:Alcohol dehydrogenase 1 [Hondaea fermentalgiana]|eukprot:GBG34646.1 Alcohol dehydrogenase 1 [Hondaea fermentalgiana]